MSENQVEVRRGTTERADSGATRTPLVDIYETDTGLTVVAELPGVGENGVSVEVDKGVLTISGQAEEPDASGFNPLYEGMPAGGSFFRAFALTDEADRDKATATFKDGVLTVVLPKAPQARTRKIPVDGGP